VSTRPKQEAPLPQGAGERGSCSPCPRHARCVWSWVLLVGAVCGLILFVAARVLWGAAEEAKRPSEEAPRLVRLRGILFDLRARQVVMDGHIALSAGVVELFACIRGTKDYESVVALDCQPYDLHLGLLAIGLKAGRPVPGDVARFQTRGPEGRRAQSPVGPPVVVRVRWKDAQGRTVTRRAEDLVLNVKTKKTMERAGWVFVGSRFVPGETPGTQLYAAALTGAVITTYNDPTAVLDNPRPTGQDDTYFVVNESVVPPVGTPVQVIVEPEKKSDVPAQP